MADGNTILLRALPDGPSLEATEAGWNGHVLAIDFPEGTRVPDLAPGTLLEMETAVKVYLGVVLDNWSSGLAVSVEHSLNRDQLESIQTVWG